MTSIEEVKQRICEKNCKYKATQDKVKEKYNSSDHECIICCELCALEELHGEDFVNMADKIDNMIDTICELGNGITEEDVKRESKILFEIRDQLYKVGGWDGNEPNHKKKTGVSVGWNRPPRGCGHNVYRNENKSDISRP